MVCVAWKLRATVFLRGEYGNVFDEGDCIPLAGEQPLLVGQWLSSSPHATWAVDVKVINNNAAILLVL